MSSIRSMLVAIITLPMILMIFPLPTHANEPIVIADHTGDALFRELGDYLWHRPQVGQTIFAGDRLRVRDGDTQIKFPQADLSILGQGEVELPVEIVGGYAEPWRNDLRLFIGEYEIDSRRSMSKKTLTILTLFGQLEVRPGAIFTVTVTHLGSQIFVETGSIMIRHRIHKSLRIAEVTQGQSVHFSLKGFRFQRPQSDKLAARSPHKPTTHPHFCPSQRALFLCKNPSN